MATSIRVLAAPAVKSETKGIVSRGVGAVIAEIDAEVLKANIEHLSGEVATLFEGIQKKQGFQLQKVEVGLEISAEGGVNLIGTMNAGAKAAIKLTFELG
jgi:hypothetical protein